MSAIAGINGDVWISTAPSTALGSPETFNDSGDHIHYFAATHQAWDPTQTFTVQNSPNGSTGWVTVTDYTVQWPIGMITFNTARGVGTNNFTRVSAGNYFTFTALDGAHAWKMSMKGVTKDVTPFQSSGSWAQNLGTYKTHTFSVDCYRYDARVLQEMITGVGQTNTSNGIVLCQLWFNEAGGQRIQFYALPTGITDTVMSTDVDKQNVTFTTYGAAFIVLSNSFTVANVIQL